MQQAIKQYHRLLCKEGIPSFLTEYVQAKEMKRLQKIGLYCGTEYTALYKQRYFYSRYDHSLAAALIVWHFTHDKIQTLAALFHDISTPVFSHSIDYMNGDALTQESTEGKTAEVILRSREIMQLLRADGIAAEKVVDYHQYPIADNDTPQLSADRLEYTFATCLIWHQMWNEAQIQNLYEDLSIQKNEYGEEELCFMQLKSAEAFVKGSVCVNEEFLKNENKLSLSFIGDMMRHAIDRRIFTMDDLYTLTEEQALQRLQASEHQDLQSVWHAFTKLTKIKRSDIQPGRGYHVHMDTKKRYINPLVLQNGRPMRVMERSPEARQALLYLLSYEDSPYGYVDFNFEQR